MTPQQAVLMYLSFLLVGLLGGLLPTHVGAYVWEMMP